jgi:hypothetical protein
MGNIVYSFDLPNQNPLDPSLWSPLPNWMDFAPLQILDGQCISTTLGDDCAEMYIGSVAPNDQTSQVIIGNMITDPEIANTMYVFVRCSSAGLYGISIDVPIGANTENDLFLLTPSGEIALGTWIGLVQQGDQVALSIQGNVLTIWVNGTPVFSAADPDSTLASGQWGLGILEAATYFDTTITGWSAQISTSGADANVSEYLSLITSEHNQRPNFMAWIAALCQPSVDQQNQLANFPSLFDIDVAVGDQLDKIGQWVGVSRSLPQGIIAYESIAVTNWSFEESGLPPPGWTEYNNGSGILTLSYDTTTPYIGLQSLVLTATDRLAGVFQAISPASPGQTYTLYAAIRYRRGGMLPNIYLGFYDSSGNYITSFPINAVLTDTGWHDLSVTATAPPGTASMKIASECDYISNPPGASETEWEIDNVSVTLDIPVSTLDDNEYRILVKLFIAMNQWDGTVPGIYNLWNSVFTAEGYQILVQDGQDMTMFVVFLNPPADAIILAILTSGYFLTRPAGVRITGFYQPSLPFPETPLFGWGVENATIAGWGVGAWIEPV